MKYGIKIAIAILLLLAVGFGYVGFTGIGIRNEWQSLQRTPFEQYTEGIQDFTARIGYYQKVGENALANIDRYIAQMEADRAALAAAAGESRNLERYLKDIDKQIDDARKQRDTANDLLNGEKRSIAVRAANVAAFLGIEESELDSIAEANERMDNECNLAKAQLKKITVVEEGQSSQLPESKAGKDYAKAVELINKAAEAEGWTVTLTPLEPGKSSAELYLEEQEIAEAAKAERLAKDQARFIRIDELEEGTSGFLLEKWDYFFWFAGICLLGAVLCLIGLLNPALLKKISATANKNMMLVALVVITLFFFVATRYMNLSPKNITNVINQSAYIIILATGMLLCIISSANIDLSVGRVMGFIGTCAAIFVENMHIPVWACLPLCLLIGIAIGAWQGFWIAYMKIPAFVVTLAGQLTFYGLNMVLLKGMTRAPFPAQFTKIFGGSLGGDPGMALWIGVAVVGLFVAIRVMGWVKRKNKAGDAEPLGRMIGKTAAVAIALMWVFYSLSVDRGLPMVLITVSVVLVVYTFLTTKTVPGRHLYAMGGNVNAARLSGVKTQRMLFLTYMNMGFLASLAGLAYSVRANSAFPLAGTGEELNAIAACYIGGASAYGGIGTVGGAVIGALTMGIIKNGMSMIGMKTDIQQVVLGLVLLAAVVIDIVSKNGSSIGLFSRFHREKKHEDRVLAATGKDSA